eukprot:gene1843-2175_t
MAAAGGGGGAGGLASAGPDDVRPLLSVIKRSVSAAASGDLTELPLRDSDRTTPRAAAGAGAVAGSPDAKSAANVTERPVKLPEKISELPVKLPEKTAELPVKFPEKIPEGEPSLPSNTKL